jgi:hypothetical protein
MDKRRRWSVGILAGVLALLLVDGKTYAHLEGAFREFLARNQELFLQGVQSEEATENLKAEIAKTKEEIARLTPKVARLEEQYREAEDREQKKVQFYSLMGVETYMQFLLEARDVTDLLAGQRILEDKLKRDLEGLEALYRQYQAAQVAKSSLEHYEGVLEMIEHHLEARKKLLTDHAGKPPQELAQAVRELWLNNQAFLKVQMDADQTVLNENLRAVVTQKAKGSPYRLESHLVNERTKLRYSFQSDHVYMQFRRDGVDMLLVGEVGQKDGKKIVIVPEAGFLNGILLDQALVAELKAIELEYERLEPRSKGFVLEPLNGALWIQPIESTGE